MSTELGEVFTAAGCDGTLLVRCLDDARSVGCGHEELVVLASTVKVLVALEAEAAFSARRLDATDQVVIDAPERVACPVGLSLFRDQATMSLRDLVVLMLTISDNAATDVLMNRIGLAAVNAGPGRSDCTQPSWYRTSGARSTPSPRTWATRAGKP